MTEYYLVAKKKGKQIWERKVHDVNIHIPSSEFILIGGAKYPQYIEVEMCAKIKDRRYVALISCLNGKGLEVTFEKPKGNIFKSL